MGELLCISPDTLEIKLHLPDRFLVIPETFSPHLHVWQFAAGSLEVVFYTLCLAGTGGDCDF